MLSLNNISLRRGRMVLLENVSFQAHPRQRLGLIGANGSGKSSLFAMFLRQLEPDAGELGLNSEHQVAHVAQESPQGKGSALDYVIDGDKELRQLQAAITEGETNARADIHGLYERMENIEGYNAESRAARLLHGLGFADDEYSKAVHAFSGGWRMRLNLAQALMCRSDMLLLDEPTNHLDLPAILWLERWLKRYEGLLIVISHDRDFLDQICTRIAHIEHQQITLFTGNYSSFEAQRAEQLAQQQSMHAKQQREITHMQAYVDRFRYKASKARQAQSRLKMLERMTLIAPAHVDSPFHFSFFEPKKIPQHLLSLSDAVLGYQGNDDNPVLTDVDLSLVAGDRIGLLGVNGAGKSTLVKALSTGSTLLKGERSLSKDTKIGYFAQHQLELLNAERSPFDHLQAVAKDDRELELRNYLGRFGFSGERIFEPVAPFSGGEKARLVLALMIRQKPNLLLLDEPTNHLDLEMRQALSVALIEYSGALVVISHDRHLLRSVCDELLIVHDGTVDRFTRDLDEYPTWLKEKDIESGYNEAKLSEKDVADKKTTKKERRQEQALLRRRLTPLSNKVRDTESRLNNGRLKLEVIDKKLADETIYTNAERQPELTQLLKDRAELASEIERLEWLWLEASEALDAATP